MADQSDVAEALVQIIAGAVYPDGIGGASISNGDVIVYQGWPNSQTLQTDLAAGKVHISVYPRPGDTVTSVMMGDTDWQELANDGMTGTGAREIRRQTKQFQITIWAPSPTLRGLVAGPVDVALALASRFALPDQTQATMAYVNQTQHDEAQTIQIYRRDFFYAVNFATLQTEAEFAIKQTITNVTGGVTETAIGQTVTRISP